MENAPNMRIIIVNNIHFGFMEMATTTDRRRCPFHFHCLCFLLSTIYMLVHVKNIFMVSQFCSLCVCYIITINDIAIAMCINCV